jgi:streptogramin lyase
MKRVIYPMFIAAFLVMTGSVAARTSSPPQSLGAWSLNDAPYDVAANAQGDVWVAFADTPRIARFDVKGAQQATVTLDVSDRPLGIATDSSGNAFVADSNNNTILKYSRAGALLATWHDAVHMNGPVGIAVDSSGNLYVADGGNDQVEKFSSTGAYVTAFGGGNGGISASGIAVDSSGNVYVTDAQSDRIVKFSSSGSQLGIYGTGFGTGNGQFDIAAYDAVDSGGNLFVSDENNHRIQEFTQPGTFLNAWGSGTDFTNALGISVDVAGNVYVADAGTNKILKYFTGLNPCTDLTGTHLSACQTAQTACMAKLVPQDEADCLNATKTQYDPFRGQSSKAARATFTVKPGVVAANGTAHAIVGVRLLTGSGDPASGKSVRLAKQVTLGSPAVSISPASATTNSAGVAKFSIKSSRAGVVHFVATDVTDGSHFTGGTVRFQRVGAKGKKGGK